MDSISVVAIIAGVGAILIAIYTHIKHSKCFGVEIDNFPPSEIQHNTTPQGTPQITRSLESNI